MMAVFLILASCAPQAPAIPTATPEPVQTAVVVVETTAPTVSKATTIAYTGPDNNLWVLELGSAELRQVTTDATLEAYNADQPMPQVSYYFPSISSDGRFLAVRRDAGTPVESGFSYAIGLWVFDLSSGDAIQVYDQNTAGFDWKPGTHMLAFGQAFEEGYFSARGQVDPSFAKSILAYDADSGATTELVKPERGFAIYSVNWSPDGSFLSFEEVNNYEGSGLFAYYDFESQTYVSWEEAIGLYDWSAGSELIAYDRLTYSASGTERIFTRPLDGGEERQFSPEMGSGYAFYPVFSPSGDRLAYFTNAGDLDSPVSTLQVQAIAGGQARSLGEFESVQSPAWTPDGRFVIFSSGPYENQQVLAVNAEDGAVTVLALGRNPDVP